MSLATLSRDSRPPLAVPQGRAAGSPEKPNGFAMLTRYIPTETVTLYVAALALKESVAAYDVTPLGIYMLFAIATPLILALVTRNAQIVDPANARPIHWFPLVASLLAFLVWGLSVPGVIGSDKTGLMALCGFGAMVLSTLLSLIEPIAMQSRAGGQTNVPPVPPVTPPAPPPPPPAG